MIIIAGTIIVSMTDNNIINKAKKVVDETNFKTIQESAALAYSQYEATGQTGSVSEYVTNWLLDNKILDEETISNYEINEDGSVDKWKGVNSPKLAEGMTPIKWDLSGNMALTNSTDSKWYNYTDREWANAVSKDTQGNIVAYWVWIPRYEYKIPIPNSSDAQIIDINFIKSTTTKATSGYTIHPAFEFRGIQLAGIWVAKFEASGGSTAVNIKPGEVSLRGMTISEMFTECINMKSNSRYGWQTLGAGIDTHLMKNIEWGAIAYLSSSIYGRPDEVWINPNSTYLTGQAGTETSASATTVTFPYNNLQYGINASTTGNTYGVYDMSGGAYEYVAAYIKDSSSTYAGELIAAGDEYKDVYDKSSSDTSQSNYEENSDKKGDAVYETSSEGDASAAWYRDYAYMPYSTDSFFRRGAYTTAGYRGGIFAFHREDGDGVSSMGFRPVLLVNNKL